MFLPCFFYLEPLQIIVSCAEDDEFISLPQNPLPKGAAQYLCSCLRQPEAGIQMGMMSAVFQWYLSHAFSKTL